MATATITARDLPAADTVRWTPKKKAAVVVAIAAGVIAESAALALYNISGAELDGWRNGMDHAGAPALRVTRMQAYPRFA